MKIIIVGCGRLGRGLAESLSQRGDAITVIDKDATALEALPSTFKGKVISGIGFDRDVLLAAGIENADGLAAITNSDETNVLTAQIARQIFHVPKVVARLYDPQQADIYNRLGLQTICTTTWGMNRMSDLLTYSSLESILHLDEVEIVTTEIPTLLAGRTVRELSRPDEMAVVAITRRGKSLIPSAGCVFEQGDVVHLAVLGSSIDDLRRMLELN